MKAVWNHIVVAESDETIMVEGNHYFPPESIKEEYFKPTEKQSMCQWKGLADYYSLEIDGEEIENVSWVYHNPKKEAENIKNYFAFYGDVKILG